LFGAVMSTAGLASAWHRAALMFGTPIITICKVTRADVGPLNPSWLAYARRARWPSAKFRTRR
jgi:hypothetical protein